jgi:hypothetical protein
MPLRLVDVGIPTFEWKRKRVEWSVSECKKNRFNELSDKNESLRRRYKLRGDVHTNLERYRRLIRAIPACPGKLIIGTNVGRRLEILGILSSDVDLREAFKGSCVRFDGKEIDRYEWLKKLTTEEGYPSICFLIGRED